MTDTFNPTMYKIALLSGGISKERDVSLASGREAKKALESAGFSVVSIDPAEKKDLVRLIEEDFDVAFFCLHGRYGEDGTMQGFLEMIHLPYTGSGVLASSLAIDKTRAKVFYEKAKLNTPKSFTFCSAGEMSSQEIEREIGFPCVVKPPKEGSSFGVHIVESAADLAKALDKVFETDKEALVETYIKGIELTVSVMGNKNPSALPVIEIRPTNEFYDFESKYEEKGSEHICPAPLNEEQKKTVQDMAICAHNALNCAGFSRSDFILDEKGEFWLLETNTLPGMTATSLLPDAAQVAGISFPELCTQLVQFALEERD